MITFDWVFGILLEFSNSTCRYENQMDILRDVKGYNWKKYMKELEAERKEWAGKHARMDYIDLDCTDQGFFLELSS